MSFAILRDRSERRRKVLAQYKFEALTDIMQLSLKKFEQDSEKSKIVNEMYGLLQKGPTVPDSILAHTKQRISILKSISSMGRGDSKAPNSNLLRIHTR